MLVVCCNQHSLSAQRFGALVHKGLAAAGRAGQPLATLGPSSVDFPTAPGEPAGLKVAVALRLDGNALASTT